MFQSLAAGWVLFGRKTSLLSRFEEEKSDSFLTNFQDVFDDRAKKLIEIMDKTDKAISEV